MVDLKRAIQAFIAEFSAIETHSVGAALRSLSDDGEFVSESERILGFEARFTLLKRMALARDVGPDLIARLDDVNERAAKLREKRDELMRTLRAVDAGAAAGAADAEVHVNSRPKHVANGEEARSTSIWMPTMAEVDKCRVSTAALQSMLRSIAERVEVGPRVQGHP